jgi:hypothetical protein
MKTVKRTSTLSTAICASLTLAFALSGSKALAQTKAKPPQGKIVVLLPKIDEAIVEEFRKAWSISGAGVKEIEGAVLLYLKPDGRLWAKSQGQTNQRRQFTFTVSGDVIAIAHTHPNSCNPQPEGRDLTIADRLGIPVLTMTNRGMYVYDPVTKRVSKLQNGLDWLDPARWPGNSELAQDR